MAKCQQWARWTGYWDRVMGDVSKVLRATESWLYSETSMMSGFAGTGLGEKWEDGAQEEVGRGQTPESLQTMLRSWEVKPHRQICSSVENSLGRQW